MIFLCPRLDKNVIKEHQDKIIYFYCKETYHKAIEGGKGICKAKGHDNEFVMPKSGGDRCFRDVFFFDLDLIVS